MSKPEFFVTPGYGKQFLDSLHYSQAVKIGNRVETSGQGGWSDDFQFPESLADEISQAFKNVERTLATAGAGCQTMRPSGQNWLLRLLDTPTCASKFA
jgi:enamine deaminase RidA (YjgF/YER057c/UK114 family)